MAMALLIIPALLIVGAALYVLVFVPMDRYLPTWLYRALERLSRGRQPGTEIPDGIGAGALPSCMDDYDGPGRP